MVLEASNIFCYVLNMSVKTFSGFWGALERPIIAMAPMDGVTDFACRAMMARHGRPDVMFTEFTTATGLFYAPERILRDFEYSEMERPIVAQLYGNNAEDFYKATHVVCELGFDGVDINMGCPSRSVTQNNCGGKLITAPDLALEIIRATRQAIQDWSQGQSLENIREKHGIKNKVVEVVRQMNRRRTGKDLPALRRLIPYSVKTRIGYDSIVIEKWVETLLSESPAVLSIHGRTLKQMYKGQARWDVIAKAVSVARGSGTFILGNGDITTPRHAAKAIIESGVDGVLIGRGCLGNPWIFQEKEQIRKAVREGNFSAMETPPVPLRQRLTIALEHARYYEEHRGEETFPSLRKHLIGYLSHFPDASIWRAKVLKTRNLGELTEILGL